MFIFYKSFPAQNVWLGNEYSQGSIMIRKGPIIAFFPNLSNVHPTLWLLSEVSPNE